MIFGKNKNYYTCRGSLLEASHRHVDYEFIACAELHTLATVNNYTDLLYLVCQYNPRRVVIFEVCFILHPYQSVFGA